MAAVSCTGFLVRRCVVHGRGYSSWSLDGWVEKSLVRLYRLGQPAAGRVRGLETSLCSMYFNVGPTCRWNLKVTPKVVWGSNGKEMAQRKTNRARVQC